MKKIATITAAVLASTSAFAGSVAYIAPDVVAIEEPSRMGSSGAWIIPLIIAAVIILAVTQSDNTPPPT
ncbi:MAG: hypothetical protein GQ535_16770 [Rhodobacteraceae bacterium]|nr:hypothetical protein [Paracoccaceae bacterium]